MAKLRSEVYNGKRAREAFPGTPRPHRGAGKVSWFLGQRPTWQRTCEPTVDTTALEHHVTANPAERRRGSHKVTIC